MDLRQKAEGAPYNLVTKFQECTLGRFWVVQLDNGLEIYQSADNPDLDEPNAWMRLKQFCQDHSLKPMNMAMASKDLNPDHQINLDPHADAFYYSKRIRKLWGAPAQYGQYQDYSQGVGQLNGNILKIIWELENGYFDVEVRDIREHPKSKPISLIFKN